MKRLLLIEGSTEEERVRADLAFDQISEVAGGIAGLAYNKDHVSKDPIQ